MEEEQKGVVVEPTETDDSPDPLEKPEYTEEDNKNDTKSVIIGIVIIIAVFALFFGGFKLYDSLTGSSIINIEDLHNENLAGDLDDDKGYIYNGFSFVLADDLWWTDINLRDETTRIPLHFGPREVEEIPFVGQINPEFNLGENVYIAIDPKVQNQYYTLALSELSFNMAKGIGRYPVGSCTEEDPACVNRTIISCNNTQGLPVIELVLDEEAKVELIGDCIKISGNKYGIVKAADRVLYHWYGIMD